jgi:hypothetical protein
MSEVKLPRVPDQPGTTAGPAAGDSLPKESASTNASPKQAASQSATTAMAAPSGTALRGILAAYESMDRAARGVAREIWNEVAAGDPRPEHIFVTASDTDLAGLAEYRSYRQSVDWHTVALNRLRDDIVAAGGGTARRRTKGLESITAASIGKVISDIIKPFAPSFTFSDTPITIESAAFAMLVAGEAAQHGSVITPYSLALRQGTGPLFETLVRDVARLEPGVSEIAQRVDALPEQTRELFEAEVDALSKSIAALEKRLRDEPSIARGAALHEVVANGLVVHVSVFAAGTELRQVSFLLGAWRRHAGGFAGAYSIYRGNGVLRRGGFVRPMLDQR